MEKIKNRIRELRKIKNITQGELAQMSCVTRQTINAIENSKYNPTLEFAMKLAKLLDVHVDKLFILEDNKQSIWLFRRKSFFLNLMCDVFVTKYSLRWF
jgi:putative transcriptional regulator